MGDSLHLAHHILHDPGILTDISNDPSTKHTLPPVIELGAGTGFLSILLAQLGADVIATDLGGGDFDTHRHTPLARLKGNVELSQ